MADEVLEKIPFLARDETSDTNVNLPAGSKSRLRKLALRLSFLLLVLVTVLSNTIWWAKYRAMTRNSCVRPQLIYCKQMPPAKHAIEYERRTLWRSIEPDNVYAGDPRDDPTREHDAAWRQLVKPMAMKLSTEEIAQLGEPSIAFKDGSGYLAEMAVFHELHCIKRIRKHFHLKFYYSNLTNDEDFMDREWRHMDHCLEYWREAAMCRGDPTLTTFVWNEGRPFSKVHSTHECINWNKLYEFAESRMVDTSDLSIFSHLSGHDEGL
ncbi:hypothetical protein K458DRAFT_366310 [Lentithecium fluviatile CBS 122367]|uniref:Tat pathway signal sequence n=1 Tax=Lentithecium fluviatile CBS 122367 TaxID=1168545 RepID=A0A6G1J386_9PLEO|nr:hypothetical protein K458DRAFT_366310 [Lentithecium fluviatile CBS 122367]